jgi:hypothetical protein
VIEAGGKLLRLSAHAQSLDDVYSAFFKEVKNEKDYAA